MLFSVKIDKEKMQVVMDDELEVITHVTVIYMYLSETSQSVAH